MKVHPEALKAIREGRLKSKKETSDLAQISLSYYCDLEAGRRPGSEKVIRQLADALKVDWLSLVENPNEARAAAS